MAGKEPIKGSRVLDWKSMKGTKGGIIAVLRCAPSTGDFDPQPDPPVTTDLTCREAGGTRGEF